jgi:hypothetical protein
MSMFGSVKSVTAIATPEENRTRHPPGKKREEYLPDAADKSSSALMPTPVAQYCNRLQIDREWSRSEKRQFLAISDYERGEHGYFRIFIS